jgi:hypothetical protein
LVAGQEPQPKYRLDKVGNNHLVNLRGLEKCNTPQLEMLYLRKAAVTKVSTI